MCTEIMSGKVKGLLCRVLGKQCHCEHMGSVTISDIVRGACSFTIETCTVGRGRSRIQAGRPLFRPAPSHAGALDFF